MLLTSEVEITLNPKYIKHLTELGYILSKRPDRDGNLTVPEGTKIMVRVDDLMSSSMYEVEVKCDYCNKPVLKKYKKYLEQRVVVKKDCCKECQGKKYLDVMKSKHGDGVKCPHHIDGISQRIREKRRRHTIEKIREEFDERQLTLLSNEFTNVDNYLKFHCRIHPELGTQEVKYANFRLKKGGCKGCRYDKVSGENAYQWKDGVSPLQNHVRDKMKKWKYDSFNYCNRRCSITGYKKSLIIHHVNKNFSEILEETLGYLKLPLKKRIRDYEEEQLKMIVDTCLELHYKYGYGIAIKKEIHELFHNKYKRQSNDKSQYIEFKERYFKGEFDNELPEKLSSENSLARLKRLT
ncbi:MAG: hypothetical protein K0R54_1594 [Clostridiaceae bacterium]|jgi:hypothetical protein|nr:hypothetical protein [Clostridiaceae bacterium]